MNALQVLEDCSLPGANWKTDFSTFVVNHPEFFSYSTFQELSYNVHISLRNKIIYFEIPKNASSSIKTLLHQIELNDPKYRHSSQVDLHSRNFSPLLNPFQVSSFRALLEAGDYFKFCVFRDPIERLVSGYTDKVVNHLMFHQEIRNSSGSVSTAPPLFSEFIYWIVNQKISDMNSHWRPQYFQSYLYAQPKMRVFNFTKLDVLVRELQRHIGDDRFALEKVAPHGTNSSSTGIDPSATEVIKKKYVDDFKIWEDIDSYK